MIRAPFLRLALLVVLFAFALSARAEPEWIWTAKNARPQERATFRRNFTIEGTVKRATLMLTCDNGAVALLNGARAAKNLDWMDSAKADVTNLIKSGANELRVEAKNEDSVAALVATLTIETTDGKKTLVETGPDWEFAAPGSADFKPAVVIAKYGAPPWGDVFAGGGGRGGGAQSATDPASLQVPAGFKVELLYTVPKAEQGSWVSMTADPQGRLIVGDQGGGLYRVTVPPLGKSDGIQVEPLETGLAGAHGLLYAFNSLYAMINEKGEHGLYRLRDTDGKGQFGNPELLRKIDGGGEHGPHGIVLGPDGQSLYFVCGNHTKLPDRMERSRAARAWDEDQIVARMWDANGHAKGILAPGGYICKTDPDGKTVELYTAGFRNAYDLAFDGNGELFTFDSDMEWDIGAPWYRPTRIAHCTSGAEFGWRSGSGKWPAHYPDNLPPTLDVGPGSPTGIVFGTGAKFPAKYQRALYAADWTYGTLYAIHLVPDGSSFRAEKEEFVAGKALPLSDLVVHPKDGAMYFAVGGRGTQSALYRVSYIGRESTALAPRVEPTSDAKLRHQLEVLHGEGTGPEAIDKAWPYLAHKDRFVRFAARVAIERQPATQWAERALEEQKPQAAIEAFVALARVGDKALQPRLLEALSRFDFSITPVELRLPLLRAWQLAFIRMGKPAPDVCAQLAAKFDPLFPQTDSLVNRELVKLLVVLDSPTVVAKTVPLLDVSVAEPVTIANDALLARNKGYAQAAEGVHASRPNQQAIVYAYTLRCAVAGWTPELRKAFFVWFPRTHAWRGGNSFTKFLDNIRTESLANFVTDAAERKALDELSKAPPPAPPANLVQPKGPGKAYTVEDVVALAKDGLHGRNFEQGKAMFAATLCVNCHHFAGEGGNIGPDITGAASRYSLRDLVENIVDPSKVISDQYGTEQFEMKDGSTVIGRVVVEENGKLFVMTSALVPDQQTTLEAAAIKSRKPFNVSMMPPGLISPLNKDELLDLLAYVLSAGNPQDRAFAK